MNSVKQNLPETIFHLLRAFPNVHLSGTRRETLRFVIFYNLSGIGFPELNIIIPYTSIQDEELEKPFQRTILPSPFLQSQ